MRRLRICAVAGVLLAVFAVPSQASASALGGPGSSSFMSSCVPSGPPGAVLTATVYLAHPAPPAGKLLGFDVSNPCWVPALVTFGSAGPWQPELRIAVLPGTTASLRNKELMATGLWLYPTNYAGAGVANITDTCGYTPNFILGPDGVMVAAIC